nr:Protein F26A1.9 [Haemonchus contortus]
MHLFNLPKVICDPFRRQFDYNRCMKFLFDCELISEWDDEEESDKETGKEKGETAPSEGSTKVLTPTPDDQKLAVKIAEEEKALEQLLKEKEKEDKEKVFL